MTSLLRDLGMRSANGVVRRVSRLGHVAEPRSWAASDWGADVLPYLLLGIMTAFVGDALSDDRDQGSAILLR